ncbi:MAG: AzlD domain-containing protein [Clostridia bacterium]|nr:AzlD domain-containing protein [Clostridia bacterium]
MTENTYIWLSVAIIALLTAALRFLPFALFGNGRKTPKIIEKLSSMLPYAIMGMLVVYCLKDTSFSSLGGFLPAFIASAVVVLLHVWKRNTLLSIISGTVCYMLLVQLVFV